MTSIAGKTTAVGHSTAAQPPKGPAAAGPKKDPPKPCWRKIIDGGPLGVMLFYLMRWHSRLAIFFGYTCLVLVTVILLCCSGYFLPGGAGNWNIGGGDNNDTNGGGNKNKTGQLGEEDRFVDY